ncbi:hypothetical protein [Atlantibacter hermannii]|uniref:hypothetical protein n=1 Tax=Atlantibacter hermannii TaxID=565 RepID=UPI0033926538
MNKKLHEPDLTDKASARLTTKQLIGAAHHAARYLPKASGELVTELASRLDVTQSALCESLKIRDVLASENGQMLRLLTDISENHDEYVNEDEYLYAGVPMDYVSEINAYVSRDVEAENPFQATDAFLAEIRKQGVIEFAAAMAAIHAECQAGGYFDRQVKVYAKAQELAESYLKQRCGEKTA